MDDLTGGAVNQYQLLDRLEDQGIVAIYRAYQPSLNRYARLTLIDLKGLSPEAVEALRGRIETIAQLNQVRILPVYDSGEEDGLAFIASRFVDGGNLEQRLRYYRQPEDALHLLEPVADALDYMQRHGVIHGNVQPSSILFDSEGEPLLTDFDLGLPPAASASTSIYRSPEQNKGQTVDARSDVYALGMLLFEMVAGPLPTTGAMPSPRAARPDLPADVEKVILKATALYPEQRFQRANALVSALEKAIAPEPEPESTPEPAPVTPPAPAPAPTPPPAPSSGDGGKSSGGSNWMMFLLGALLILLLIWLLVWMRGGNDNNQGDLATPPPVEEVTPPAGEQPVEPPAEEQPAEPPAGEQPAEPPADQPAEPPAGDQPAEPAPGG